MNRTVLLSLTTTHFPYAAGYAARALGDAGIGFECVDSERVSCHEEVLIDSPTPDVIVAAGTTIGFRNSREILNQIETLFPKIKKLSPQTKIILCGEVCSTIPRHILERHTEADALIYGVPEIWTVLPGLVRAFAAGERPDDIPGIALRKNGRLIDTDPPKWQNLKRIPFCPDWSHFDVNHYLESSLYYYNLRLMPIVHGTGCAGKCTFCTRAIGPLRFRPVDDVVAEMGELADKYDFDGFYFQHGYFYPNPKSIRAFAESYIKAGIKKPWFAQARSDMDVSSLKLMAEAGCRVITFGLESADDNLLKRMKKGTDANTAAAFVRSAREAGIHTHCTFMVGNVGESFESLGKTIDFINDHKLDFTSIYLTLSPGSALYREAIEQKIISDEYSYIKNWEHPFPTEYKFRDMNYLNVSGMDDESLFRTSSELIHKATINRYQNELCRDINLNTFKAKCRCCSTEINIPFSPWTIYNLHTICPECWAKNAFMLIDDAYFGDHVSKLRQFAEAHDNIVVFGLDANAYAIWHYAEAFGIDPEQIRCYVQESPEQSHFFDKHVIALSALTPEVADGILIADSCHTPTVKRLLQKQGFDHKQIISFLPPRWSDYVSDYMRRKPDFWDPLQPFYFPHSPEELRELGRTLARHYMELYPDRPVIALGFNGTFAKTLAQIFREAGIDVPFHVDVAQNGQAKGVRFPEKNVLDTVDAVLLATPAYSAQRKLRDELLASGAREDKIDLFFQKYMEIA